MADPSRRCGADRGAAIVEMALVVPFLALLVAGIVEFGTLWRDDLTLSSGTRAAARVVSNLGDNRLADYDALVTLDSALSSADGLVVEAVLIFDASAADGLPHSSCFDGSGDPQASVGYCNLYTGAQLSSMSSLNCVTTCAEFPNNADCSGGLAVYFCPQDDRETSQAVGTTNVGVWVKAKRDYYTGVFPGDGVTMTDRTVMKVEPR